MKNLLEYILIHLVQYPEDVKIDETQDERGFLYTIHVNSEDIGRVIGKGGAVIHSIRNIGKIRAIKEGIRARITIDDGKERPEYAPTAAPVAEEMTTEAEVEVETSEESSSEE
ncbi:KH domain-containing protein [Candidatus Woesebacteria bacterium]|nr:KH domain-containing protein [Candidatus Woesebacteria bacterium]